MIRSRATISAVAVIIADVALATGKAPLYSLVPFYNYQYAEVSAAIVVDLLKVCNWFANWRRKLKNAGKEPQKKTWGHLIKSYNSQVRGNVEHFSICSDDSIWQEPDSSDEQPLNFDGNANYESRSPHFDETNYYRNNSTDHCYTIGDKNQNFPTSPSHHDHNKIVVTNSTECLESNPFSQYANKYKNHIMEKYLRDCQKPENYPNTIESEDKFGEETNKPSMITKWIESAENFKPSEYSYLQWTFSKAQRKKLRKPEKEERQAIQQHGREELDAAEALTKLALASSANCFTKI